MRKIISLISVVSVLSMSICNISYANSDSYILKEDFESYTQGTKLSEIYPAWIVKDSNNGDSVTIENDPVSGNKAVRITQTKQAVTKNSNPETGFAVNLERIASGTVEIGFSIRQEVASAMLNAVMVSGTTGGIGNVYNYRTSLYLNSMSKQLASLDASKYTDVKFTIDIDNGKYNVSSKTGTVTKSLDVKATVNDVNKLQFFISGNYGDGAASWIDPAVEGNPVYWIDNITVKQNAISVESITPEDESENAPIDKDIIVTFNAPLDRASANSETKIYENDELVDASKYSLSVNDKILTVSFIDAMEYYSDYKIVFSKNLKSTDSSYKALGMEKSYVFKTERLFKKLDVKENYTEASFTIPEIPNTSISAILTDEAGGSSEYISGTVISELGKYKLSITARNTDNNKEQSEEYEFNVVGKVVPEAKDVKITWNGIIEKNSVLKGEYKYFDVNGDEEGTTTFKWFSSDKKDGDFKEITGATQSEYTLTDDDLNKFFKFSVIPVAKTEPTTGKEVHSDVTPGFFLPVAENVSIMGDVVKNGILRALYKYYDENETEEGNTLYQWYRSTDDGKSFIKIDGANQNTYVICDDDTNAMLKVGITPQKSTAKGVEVFSETISGLCSPQVENVKIEGDARVNRSIYLSYLYSDANNDEEGETRVDWYCDGKLVSTEKNLIITKAMGGKSVYAEVTPVSINFPYEGKSVRSNQVTIEAEQVKSGGGGGSSAGGIFSQTTKKEDKKENKTLDEQKDNNQNTTKKVFVDIKGHWAETIIEKMCEKGIIKGIDETHFNPNANVTRAQFASMIMNMLELKNEDFTKKFDDVKTSDWYYNAVENVAEAGLMSGYNGKFRPNDSITREELCNVAVNLIKQKGMYEAEVENAGFTDFDMISDWAKEAVNFASKKGIVTGKTNGEFQPKNKATRAESLVILERLSVLLTTETA